MASIIEVPNQGLADHESKDSTPPARPEGSHEDLFESTQPTMPDPCIKVIGVGGGGGNAIQRMADHDVNQVELICANTDAQALRDKTGCTRTQIGREATKGLGAGADPESGRLAAEESRDMLWGLIDGADMLFITAGMGGGTGTGAAPVIAEMSKQQGILTVAVVTRPFMAEGRQRIKVANQGIDALRQHVDALIIIPNERLLEKLPPTITMEDAFLEADGVLHNAVKGIADLIMSAGRINADFADVCRVMKHKGSTMMGTGIAEGDNRAIEATQQAINSELLEEVEITNARGVLVNLVSNQTLTMQEYEQVNGVLEGLMAEDDEAIKVVGTAHDESLGDKLKVTLVVAGFDSAQETGSAGAGEDLSVVGQGKNVHERINPLRSDQAAAEPTEPEPVPEAKAAVLLTTDGNTARVTKNPDWNNQGERQNFDIPAYLRKQHD